MPGRRHVRQLPSMPAKDGVVTVELVRSAREGDRGAVDRLFALAYAELLERAHKLRRRGAPATLNSTALVHEAYLKLKPGRELDIEDRAHFGYVMVRAMRQVLVDQARRRGTAKRGGGDEILTLREHDGAVSIRSEQLLALDDALERLAKFDPRRAQVVECRFYCGFSVEETAETLGISEPTVKRDWRVARAWLAQEVGEEMGA